MVKGLTMMLRPALRPNQLAPNFFLLAIRDLSIAMVNDPGIDLPCTSLI
jgi:hypothetical protein